MTERTWRKVDVAHAQTLRERRAEIRKQIAALEAEREPLSGAEKGAVTRQITPLEEKVKGYTEALKDLPPEPLSPDEAATKLMERIQDALSDALNTQSTFITRAHASLKDALIWNAEEAVKAEMLEAELVSIAEAPRHLPEMHPYHAMSLRLNEIIDQTPQKLSSHDRIHNSTGWLQNVVNGWTLERYANRAGSWSDMDTLVGLRRWATNMWDPRVEAWEILNDGEEAE